jgi:hypothetical protein
VGDDTYRPSVSPEAYGGPYFRFDNTAWNANMFESVYLKARTPYQFLIIGNSEGTGVAMDLFPPAGYGTMWSGRWSDTTLYFTFTPPLSGTYSFYAENRDWSYDGIRVIVW